MTDVCPTCGEKVAGLDREIRLRLPQPIVDILGEDPTTKRFSIAPGGSFIRLDKDKYFARVLLPVSLDIDYEFHYGVWMAIDKPTAKHLWRVWEKPEYANVQFSGQLANLVPPWNKEIEGAECTAEVRDAESVPYIFQSTHPVFAKILSEPWPVHECQRVIDEVWGEDLEV